MLTEMGKTFLFFLAIGALLIDSTNSNSYYSPALSAASTANLKPSLSCCVVKALALPTEGSRFESQMTGDIVLAQKVFFCTFHDLFALFAIFWIENPKSVLVYP